MTDPQAIIDAANEHLVADLEEAAELLAAGVITPEVAGRMRRCAHEAHRLSVHTAEAFRALEAE